LAKGDLPPKNKFVNESVGDYKLEEEIGRGKIGVVYRGRQANTEDLAACKIIPHENLKGGTWQREIQKISKLHDVPTVVQYKGWATPTFDGIPYICILYQYIGNEGQCADNLQTYINKNPSDVTLQFIKSLTENVLATFHAMQVEGIQHNDLHEGNILIYHNPHDLKPGDPTIKITDFGIGERPSTNPLSAVTLKVNYWMET